jgi:dihydrofolate reductase
MKISVFIATSLDGYIAREDGRIDWLPVPDPDAGEDYGYKAFMATVDAIVMGRATFETVLGFGVWPYAGKRVVVLSSRPLGIPETFPGVVEQLSGSPADVAAALSSSGVQQVYLDGGKTVQGFLAAGLVDRLIITRIPVLIGSGLPLFGPLANDVALRHVATRAYPSGFVQSEYSLFRGE